MDAFWLAVAVMVMPASSYFAIHMAVLNHLVHFWSLLILGCAPVAFVASIPDGLWWLPMPPRYIKGLSRLLLVLAALGLLAGANQLGRPLAFVRVACRAHTDRSSSTYTLWQLCQTR